MLIAALDAVLNNGHLARNVFEVFLLLVFIFIIFMSVRRRRLEALEHWEEGLRHPSMSDGEELDDDDIDPEEKEIRQLLAQHNIHLNEAFGDELDYRGIEAEWELWFNCGGGMALELTVRWENEQWKVFEILDENDEEELFLPWLEFSRYVEESKAMAMAHLARVRQYQPAV
jgi:hypothetical protein